MMIQMPELAILTQIIKVLLVTQAEETLALAFQTLGQMDLTGEELMDKLHNGMAIGNKLLIRHKLTVFHHI